MKTKAIILAATMLMATAVPALACTDLLVGKKASVDGSVLVSYSCDGYGGFGTLFHQPRGTHKPGDLAYLPGFGGGSRGNRSIPQVAETYNVVGNMNEYQLTITESTFDGRTELVNREGLFDYASLIYLTLARTKTAREAIKTMTDLVAEYGYNSTGESFFICDPNEAWIMEMIGKGPDKKGAVWVAVRIPDDCISAHANQSRIHKFALNDPQNCLYAPDVISLAREKGYFSGKDEDFSFSKAYNPIDFSGRRFCEARVWSFYNKYTDIGNQYLNYVLGKSDEPLPLYVKPNRKLSVQDVKDAMRDHYEGTPLDPSLDVSAGPYHTPYRPVPLTYEVDGQTYFNERMIGTPQSAWVFVAQMRSWLPNAIGGVNWWGTDDATMTIFVPLYCCLDVVPECFRSGTGGANIRSFSWDSSFWVNNWVANMVYPRYGLMIGDVKAVQHDIENGYNEAQAGIDSVAAEFMKTDEAKAREFLTNYSNMAAKMYMDTWKQLGEYLVVKYNDMVVQRMDTTHYVGHSISNEGYVNRPGIPADFAKEMVKLTGDRYKQPTE